METNQEPTAYGSVTMDKLPIIPDIVYTLADDEDELTTTEIVHTFPTQETTTVDEKTGVVTVTTTDTALVRITKNPAPSDTETVTLRNKRASMSEEEKKEFAKEMERQRREIIAVQRRSTPSDFVEAYANALAAARRPDADSHQYDGETNGEVDSQSILDNKEGIKKFLMSKMQIETETQGEEATASPKDSNARLASVRPPNLLLTTASSAGTVSTGQVQKQQATQSADEGAWSTDDEDSMHVVAARPCYVEQPTGGPVEFKREKAASAVVTESKIAREIEECRLREEELKLRRAESQHGQSSTAPRQLTLEVGHPDILAAKGGQEPEAEVSPVLQAPAVQSADDSTEYGVKQDDQKSSRRYVKVRPLVDDESEEEDTLTYVLSKESVVEREIRLTREREEELRKEKELALKLAQGSATPVEARSRSTEGQPEARVVKSPVVMEAAPQFTTVGDVPPTEPPVPKLPNVPSLVDQAVKAPDPAAVVSRENQRNLASARLQQEVNEIILKELALKEAGSIVTTSRDRVDDKVINLRQYREVDAVSGGSPTVVSPKPDPVPPAVPQSAPPVVTNGFVPADTPNAFFAGRQFLFRQNAQKVSRQTSLANGLGHTTSLHRSPTTKGVMARFIASRGKITAMPVFVPKVPKEPITLFGLSPVLSEPSPTPSPDPSSSPKLVQPAEAQISLTTILTKSVSSERPTYIRRSFSSAENKILEELKEMKAREEELRQQRITNFGKSYSLENLLEDDDHFNGHGPNGVSNGMNGTNGVISNGHHLAVDNQDLLLRH